jgi:hypothetical protein
MLSLCSAWTLASSLSNAYTGGLPFSRAKMSTQKSLPANSKSRLSAKGVSTSSAATAWIELTASVSSCAGLLALSPGELVCVIPGSKFSNLASLASNADELSDNRSSHILIRHISVASFELPPRDNANRLSFIISRQENNRSGARDFDKASMSARLIPAPINAELGDSL